MKSLFSSFFLLFTFFIVSSTVFSQQNWNTPTDYFPFTPLAIHFENENDGWSVGDFGRILRTTDGGETWNQQSSGTTRALFSVDFLNTDDGFAVGGYGTLLTTHNGGESWSTSLVGESSMVNKIIFTDNNTGWIGADAFIYKTIDGGVSWDTVYQNYDMSIYDMEFLSSTEGWAVGMLYDNGYQSYILHTTDGGNTWTQQFSPITPQPFVNYQVNGVDFVSATEGYVVTAVGDILKTTDAGSNWVEVSSSSYPKLSDVKFSNLSDGVAVGDGGLILKTTDAGLTWTQITSAVNQNLVAISQFSDTLWIGGTGRLLRSENSGDTWNTQLSTTSFDLAAADYINETTGWAVGYYGTVLGTNDGGQSWDLQNSFTNNWFTDIEFYNENLGYIVGNGGSCYLTLDGGVTWNTQFLGTGEGLLSINYRPDSVAFTVGNNTIINLSTGQINSSVTNVHRSVCFATNNDGWISGDQGEILHTTDGGDSWTSQNADPMYNLMSVYFIDQNTGWAVGTGGTILKTTDGGANWTPQNSNVTSTLAAVHFISGNIGWAVGEQGKILFTSDGGVTWIQEPSPTTTHLMSINFLNGSKGVITGERGEILLADCTSSILDISAFSLASDINSCTGSITLTTSNETEMVTSSFNGDSPVSFTGNWTIEDQCPGIYEVSTIYGCGLTQSSTVIIPIDSNYIFNNGFIDSLAQDSLGITLENCDIYYAGIDTAYIDSIWANGNTVNIIWNIIDSNGSNFDTTVYSLNNGNGVYWLQLSVFCPTKSVEEYFSVTEAIYFEDGNVSTAGMSENYIDNFGLYPNPTTDLVTVEFEGANAHYTIYDAQGKLIQTSIILSGGTVSLRDVQTGVYFFELTTESGRTVKRVVKN